MLSHLSFGVSDLDRAAGLYERSLAPLGFVRLWGHDRGVGFGEAGGVDRLALFAEPRPTAPGRGFHLAFVAPSRAAVVAFHAAALAAGGRDCGAAGPRQKYGARYYAAFVIDLDGYILEAVHQ